jgi:hypothetical protein
VRSDDRRSTIDKYEGKWAEVRDHAAAVIESGETDLSRAVRIVDAEERSLSLEPLDGVALGERVTLPRAAMTGARRDLIQRILLDACAPDVDLVAELGSGGGINLLNLHLWGGPKVPYFALEPTASGRRVADLLAGLDDGLDLTTLPYDYEHPDYGGLPTGNAHALVFTVHSIEQVTELPREAIAGLLGLGARVTGVHFEPVGWQILDEPDEASYEFAQRQRYNRNLWPLLQELEGEGKLVVATVTPDLFGDKYKNPGTLIVWNAA